MKKTDVLLICVSAIAIFLGGALSGAYFVEYALTEGDNTLGAHYNNYDLIVLNTNKIAGFDDATRTLYHELGHEIWYNELNKSEQIQYCEEYYDPNESVSDYGATECTEDFAEYVAFYGEAFLKKYKRTEIREGKPLFVYDKIFKFQKKREEQYPQRYKETLISMLKTIENLEEE